MKSKDVAQRLGISQRHARRLIVAGDDRLTNAPPPPVVPQPAHEDANLRRLVHEADKAFGLAWGEATENQHRYTDGMELLVRLKLASVRWEKVLEIVYDLDPEEATTPEKE
jgi:hypothetical protein